MKYLKVELIPWKHSYAIELRVRVDEGYNTYEHTEIIPDDAFHSMFERLMDKAKAAITQLVEKGE